MARFYGFLSYREVSRVNVEQTLKERGNRDRPFKIDLTLDEAIVIIRAMAQVDGFLLAANASNASLAQETLDAPLDLLLSKLNECAGKV
ncbi:MAG: hypothetical protein IBX56_00175 [Methylomicrobium sp.]|nr:hypothetical protein [Methylomicrobium sp.]